MVSDKLVNNLFDGNQESALGRELLVQLTGGSYTFRIVGVYKYEQSAFSFSTASDKDISTSLYIPLSTAKQLVGADRGFSNITVQAALGESSTEVAAEVKNYLSRYYRTNENYTVTAISMDTMISSVDSMMSTLSVAISVIAGISLLVGGIGVMNIMLVSVTERTREIGTRKALGATNNNIRLQFVVESVIICLIGGAIGIVLGAIMGYVGSGLLKNAVLPSIGVYLLSGCWRVFRILPRKQGGEDGPDRSTAVRISSVKNLLILLCAACICMFITLYCSKMCMRGSSRREIATDGVKTVLEPAAG